MNRVLAFILTSTAALALTGCKADAGKTDPTASSNAIAQPALAEAPSAPTPEAASDPRPLLACFGDSITAGLGVDPGVTYPDDLQQHLDSAGYHYRVANFGVSGDTTKDGVDRLPRLLAHHPAIVALEFGGNDGLRGLPLEQTEANLANIIQQLQAAHVKVVLAGITLPPDYGPAYITRFNAIYTTLARRYRLPYSPFILQGVYGVPGSMQSDGIHPTAQGDKQLAANVQKLITPLLQR